MTDAFHVVDRHEQADACQIEEPDILDEVTLDLPWAVYRRAEGCRLGVLLAVFPNEADAKLTALTLNAGRTFMGRMLNFKIDDLAPPTIDDEGRYV